jgi:hypothetical protein
MTVGEWASFLNEFGADIGSAGELDPAREANAGVLPADHLELLRLVNGATVAHGAFRLFGLGRSEPALDLITWNSRDTWRFAWDNRIDLFLMFGETAWGDQYAYKWESHGVLSREVYFLEGVTLRPEVLAPSFGEFMINELMRNAREPYDEMTIKMLNRNKAIPVGNHWAYAPSILLGGVESPDNVVELPAATAMIFAGDIVSALDAARPESSLVRVVPWTDELGRARMAVEFA